MDGLRATLLRTAELVADYRDGLTEQPVGAAAARQDVAAALGAIELDGPVPVDDVLSELAAHAAPGLVASAGPRYYGFVTGGTLDAALAAELLAVGWDQLAFNEASSPAAIAFEDAAGRWLKQLLGVPEGASVGFATGAQGANTVGLAAARWHVLRSHGWDVGRAGLRGGPPVRVVVGAERHATIDRSVRLLGLGEDAIEEVPADAAGAMDVALLPAVLAARPSGPTIVCAQAGNVNTGACDDLRAVAEAARRAGAWVHVDGAFGLWAAVSPRTAHLVAGLELADSWACDGHKWLNVPYDAGYVFCAHPDVHATAMAYTADYLTGQVAGRVPGGGDFVAESSRRARGFATWAALRSLGRNGVVDLVDRCCTLASSLAARLDAQDGVDVVNDVVLNQVLARVGDAETTDAVAQWLQAEGTVWLGATTWRGERLLRISISNWSTTERDVERCADAIARARAAVAVPERAS